MFTCEFTFAGSYAVQTAASKKAAIDLAKSLLTAGVGEIKIHQKGQHVMTLTKK